MSPLSFVRVASPATSVVACNRGLARARATPDIFFFLCRCSVSLFRTHTHRLPRVWCLPYFWQKKVPEPHPVEGEGPCGSRGPRQEMRCPFCVVKNHRGFFTGWEEDEEEKEVEKQKKKVVGSRVVAAFAASSQKSAFIKMNSQSRKDSDRLFSTEVQLHILPFRYIGRRCQALSKKK